MNRLHVLAAAGLVALAGCTDDPTTPSVAPPETTRPGFSIAVTPFGTADGLAQTLGGPGVTIQNVTYSGSDLAAGTYSGGTTAIGFDGIVLATGRVSEVGPNTPFNTSGFLGRPGDAELDAIAGVPTLDAANLSFEIVPASGDSVYFEYVFASDEYPEYAGGNFADAFLLKVNGVNCAVIGSPPVPISINTVNAFTNSSYYRTNAFPADISADALTTVLTCRAAVNPGVPNTVKLAIADGGDDAVDSWVFIKAGSFSTTPPGEEPVNAAPVLAPIANQAVNEGSAAGFTASATDADAGQTITYSLIGAPAGASIDPATGVFSWTPTDDDPTATPSDAHVFTVRATDDGDPAAFDEQSVTITVSNVAPAVTSVTGPVGPIGISGGSAAASISVAFTDPGSGDTHTTSIACGNSTSASGAGVCTYTAAGVYTVTATVTDDDGGSDSGTYQYVVVYDPGAGFVTGGGWITSPAGAYAANPALTGRANFGFNSKYKNGAQVPDGQTQFHFKAGDLNFHSTAYEWLVVAGARAQYKGTGTINGSGSYAFLLTVIDGQRPGGGGVDRFRLKIWGAGGVIYDNQMGDGDDAAASTALGGGSIVIHSN